MAEVFVSEPLIPSPGSCNASAMATGTPGVPQEFTWRDQPFHVEKILSTWKETGPCTHGSSERYLRRHGYDIRTAEGPNMRIYCDRRPSRGKALSQRWWVFTVDEEMQRDPS